MAARLASGGGALAALVRETQDLAGFARVLDRSSWHPWRTRKVAAMANRSRSCASRSSASKRRLAALSARLEKEFPDYAALASPKPLAADEVQKLLGPDEALVFFLTGKKEPSFSR